MEKLFPKKAERINGDFISLSRTIEIYDKENFESKTLLYLSLGQCIVDHLYKYIIRDV